MRYLISHEETELGTKTYMGQTEGCSEHSNEFKGEFRRPRIKKEKTKTKNELTQ